MNAPIDLWQGMPASLTPRDWQLKALPIIVDAVRSRKRSIVSAVMGSGKSVTLSALCNLALAKRGDRAIVVGCPSQMLVTQLEETLSWCLGKKNVGVFYGKKKQPTKPVIVTCYRSLANLEFALARQRRKVSLLVCDEVHQTQAEEVRNALESLNPAGAIGFTATPYRSDTSERLEIWDRVVYQYTLADAWRDEVLVPWRIINWSSEGKSLLGVDLRELTNEATADFILDHGLKLGPGIVSAYDIADAIEHAEFLRSRGIRAEPIHSKLSKAQRQSLERRLREGDLDCLVHISMLAEGVDFPWLRWLAMRRQVKARVRFAQEVGRVLRVDPKNPGKTYGLIFDPHDLFGLHGVAHEPAVGTPEADEVHLMEEDDGRPKSEGVVVPRERRIPPPKDVDSLTQWTRQFLLALQAEGLGTSNMADGAWRDRKATPDQLAALTKFTWATKYIPEPRKSALQQLTRPEIARGLNRGAVSDIIDIFAAACDAARESGRGSYYRIPTLPSVPEPPDVPALRAWRAP